MNKKGLTIYSLLALIAGIVVIIVILLPIGKSIYEDKIQETYDKQIEDIISASRVFAGNNRNFIPQDGIVVNVGKLIDDGYLKPTRNQENRSTGKTNKVYEDPKGNDMRSYKVKIYKKDDQYKIELIECGTWTSKIKLSNYCN